MSRSKSEYFKAGGVDDGEELKLQGEKVESEKLQIPGFDS